LKYSLLVALTLLVLGTELAALEDAVGKLTFLDGSVQVFRDGVALPNGQVKEGMTLYNDDQIRTGKATEAEIQLQKKTGVGATLHLKASTVVILDVTSQQTTQAGAVDLVLGSVSLKVDKLVGGNTLSVRTPTASMGVRGTEFDVTIGTADDVLLATDTGKVEVTTEAGATLFSQPGTVVQSSEDGVWAAQPVPVTGLMAFRKKFLEDSEKAFLDHPAQVLDRMAEREEARKLHLEEKLAELFSKPSDDAVVRAVRKALLDVEGSQTRLQELRDQLGSKASALKLAIGGSAADLFDRLDKVKKSLQNKRDEFRSKLKTLLEKNQDPLPRKP
jgi:hypothetical protein